MTKKRSTNRKSPSRAIVGGIVVAAVVLGGLLLGRRGATPGPAALPEDETAFSVSTHVGEPAPSFTATGVDGGLYTVTPGDGRSKALVFYMGFG